MGMWGMRLMLSLFKGVRGFGSGNRKVEGEMLLEFAESMDWRLQTHGSRKKLQGRLITYEFGRCKTAVDYILSKKSDVKEK